MFVPDGVRKSQNPRAQRPGQIRRAHAKTPAKIEGKRHVAGRVQEVFVAGQRYGLKII